MQTRTGHTDTEAQYAHRLRKIIRPIMGFVTGLTGLAYMSSAIIPKLNWDILLGVWPGDSHYGMHKLTIIVGFFLVMLACGLKRGKRQAWCATVILLLLSALLQVLRGGSVLATIVIVVLVTLLVLFSRYFCAKSDPPSVRRGYLAMLTGLGIVTLYTIGGFLVLYQQFEPVINRFGIEQVLLLLLTNAQLHLSHGTQVFFFERALPALCLSAVLYGIAQILRPVAAALLPNQQERQVASTLTRMYGTNSISYFALDLGKAYFFSTSGKSFISYVLEGNVAVVAGDPIGPEKEALSVIKQFMVFCQEQDWRIIFWQVRDALVDGYRTAGLHVLKIGEDAIIPTCTFTLTGKAMANVRSSVKRAEKEGIHIIFSHGQVQDARQMAQMEQISRSWLANKGGSEKGFSMGHFDAHGDREQVYALAVDTANTVHAFVSFVPIYGRNGWGLDLMRRDTQAAPRTMELLLVRSIEYLKGAGADIVSLGLAPLSNVNDIDLTHLASSIDFLAHLFGNSSNYHSLFMFKKKFQPRWESRYLVFSHTLPLPKVGWAVYRVHHHDMSLLKMLGRPLKDWQASHQTTRRKLKSNQSGVNHWET